MVKPGSNRVSQGYRKTHWIDAACVGESGAKVSVLENIKPFIIKAKGRGSSQMCRVNKYGFPRAFPKSSKMVKGFDTGDLVKAVVTTGEKIGTYIVSVAIRTYGSFDIQTTKGVVQVIS